MLKEELEAIIKSDNSWAGRSTLILAIGILGEYAALPFFDKSKAVLVVRPKLWIVLTSRIGRILRKRARVSPIAFWIDLDSWKKVLKIVFAVMVVAGISGEYGFSSRISRNADKLQELSDSDLTEATDRANEATRGNFMLSKQLEQERQKTARFQTQAAVSQTEVLEAESALADKLSSVQLGADIAARNLEAEKQKRAKLAASLLPRDFIDQSGTITALRSLIPTKVLFEWVSDREALTTAEQINLAVAQVGWPVSGRRPPKGDDFIRDGIEITPGYAEPVPASPMFIEPQEVRDMRQRERMFASDQAARTLIDGLMRSNVEATIGNKSPEREIPPDVILVSVGLKPQTVLKESLKELSLPTAKAAQGMPPVRGGAIIAPNSAVTISGNRLPFRADQMQHQ